MDSLGFGGKSPWLHFRQVRFLEASKTWFFGAVVSASKQDNSKWEGKATLTAAAAAASTATAWAVKGFDLPKAKYLIALLLESLYGGGRDETNNHLCDCHTWKKYTKISFAKMGFVYDKQGKKRIAFRDSLADSVAWLWIAKNMRHERAEKKSRHNRACLLAGRLLEKRERKNLFLLW